ncbi:MAG: TonB-dependent receptor [Bacteroidales bacterium]|nr:TonB-dependent receptor [Bacteroidales bacterium]
MRKALKSILLAFTTLIAGTVAYAQVTTSSLGGRITDQKGETVVGAAIIATHTPSGTVYGAVTNSDGSYRINGITPGGPYTVSVEMLGFRNAQYQNVYAPLGETVTIDATLEDESLSLDAAVFVADGRESNMNIKRSGAGTSVSLKTIEALPTTGRTLYDVMKLTPQAASTTNGLALGGGNYRSSYVTVDGAAFNNAFGIGSNLPTGGAPISLDAIEQMSVNLTPFDVRQSGFTGGAINAVTKSGTNEWHASVYNYFSNEQLTGDRIQDGTISLAKSLSNTTGFTIGGPIIKNKLFFFVNAEYAPETVPVTGVANPTASDTDWQVGASYDSNTRRPTEKFMEEVKKYLAEEYKYDPGAYQNYSVAAPDWKIMARLDWNINRDNRFNIRFSRTHNGVTSGASGSVSPLSNDKGNMYSSKNARNQNNALNFQSTRYDTAENFTSLAAELNSRLFEGNGANMFRFTWSHQNEVRSFYGDRFSSVDILNNNAVLTSFGQDPFTYGNLRDVQTLIGTDEFTYTLGKHNLLAGAQFEWNYTQNGYLQMGNGYYLFDSWDAFKNKETPKAFAITFPNNATLAQTFPSFTYMQASLYLQDEMNLSPYFKLTAGLRLEMPIYPVVPNNRNGQFDTLAESSKTFNGLHTDDMPAARINVSPRIGFNWDVLKNRSLVVRGGTGIYTGRLPFVWIVSVAGNSNMQQMQYFDGSNSDGIQFHTNVADAVQELKDKNLYALGSEPAPQTATILDKNLRMPSSWKSSLAIDGMLPGGIKASLEGIFNKDFNTTTVRTLGYTQDATGTTLPGEPAARDHWTSEGLKNTAGKDVTPVYMTNTPVNGYYYSVTASLQKEFNFGLSLMAAYTRSGSQTVGEGYGDQVTSARTNTYTVNGPNTPELGYSGFVSPNRLIGNISYRIQEGDKGTTTIGLFYEGYNYVYVGSYSYTRYSHIMSGRNGIVGNELIYIPTADELKNMPFSSDANRDAFEAYIAGNKYLSAHRGEYSKRGGFVAPFYSRVNFKIAQDINFRVANKMNTFQIALDVNNIGNLLNSNWGLVDQVSTDNVLAFKDNKYTFTAPTWGKFKGAVSTWNAMVTLRWFF